MKFADGQSVVYRVPVIMADHYTVDSIFEKRLLLLLPYHILRYEHFLKSNQANEKRTEQLLDDYREINSRLSGLQEAEGREQLYVDLVELIGRIADHVIPVDNPIRERIGEAMGGQVLKLRSEELREEGREEGRTLELYSLVQDGDISPERAAKRLEITEPVLKNRMETAGYRYPGI